MKFDYIIGNPPYQEERKGESTTALPIYHNFMREAYSIGSVCELITPARFLFNAGRTPKEWNKQMLADEHFRVVQYIHDASTVFPNTEIKGGVVISYYDSSKTYKPVGIFTVDETVNNIITKASAENKDNSIGSLCFVATKFNLEKLVSDYPIYSGHERRMSSNVLSFECFDDINDENKILIYGNESSKRKGRYIKEKYVDVSDRNIFRFKIIVPKADGNGAFGDTITNPEILEPKTGFTHTFMGIGGFDTYKEAEAALHYIKTKFARTLLSVLKVTQDVNADKWSLVPIQDFTDSSDINWSLPIPEIDAQLYKKYSLSESEIAFIESHVKEME